MILTKIKSFLQSPLGNKVKAAVNTYWFYGFFALVLFVFLMYSFSFIFGLAKDKKDSFAEEYKALPEVEESRSALPDPDNPLVFHQFVDYSKIDSAPWRPRKEAPMLAELVEAGKLPPVRERVGEEPIVVEGYEGNGQYGGKWHFAQTDMRQRLGQRYNFVGFVRWSPEGPPVVPYFARDWKISRDKRTYTFYLRKGMKWSDGHPFTTKDILFAYDINMGMLNYRTALQEGEEPKIPNLPVGLTVDTKVEALDSHTIRFTFKEPNGVFLQNLATFQGMRFFTAPEHYLRQYNFVSGGGGNVELIEKIQQEKGYASPKQVFRFVIQPNNPDLPSMAPWICRKQAASPPYTYVRNPYYPMVDTEGRQLPYLDWMFVEAKDSKILDMNVTQGIFSVFPFLDGYVDYTHVMDQAKAGQKPLFARLMNNLGFKNVGKKDPGYKVKHWYTADTSKYSIFFNLNKWVREGDTEAANKNELFKNVNFRRAMSLAIDRERINEALFSGVQDTVQSFPRKESPFYVPGTLEKYAEFDPERANALLDEAGYTNYDEEGFRTFKDGSPILIEYIIQDTLWEGVTRFVIEDWQNVGINAILVIRGPSLLSTMINSLTFDVIARNSNNEFLPILEPRLFVPRTGSYYALGYYQYFEMLETFTHEEIVAREIPQLAPVPKDHPLKKAFDIWREAQKETEIEKQAEVFSEVVKIAAENVWSIGLVDSAQTPVVVKKDFHNVSDSGVSAWDFLTPYNMYPETFYSTSMDTKEETEELMSQIVTAQFDNESDKFATSVENTETTLFGKVIAVMIWIIIGALLIAFLAYLITAKPYIMHRLLLMIPTLLVISIIAFSVINLPDGNYVTNKIMEMESKGQKMDDDEIQILTEMFYLEDPLLVKYARWMGLRWFVTFENSDKGLLQGHMGYSMETKRPVGAMIGDRLLLTMGISLFSVLFMWVLSLPLGVYIALKQYSFTDYAITFIGFLGMCVPNFVLALMFIALAESWFGIKISGLFSPEFASTPGWSFAKILDLLKHIWVPVIVSAAAGTGASIRGTRANMLDEMRKPYVATSLAKGVSFKKTMAKYPFRMILNPFVSSIGNIFPLLVSGGALIAIVLSLPTIGPLQLNSVMSQDMYMAGSLMMLFTFLSVIGTLVSDLLLLVLDPRIRYTGGNR